MKLTVPVRNIAEINFAHKLWIQDVYAGYIDQDLEKQEKWSGIYNGRSSSDWNFQSIKLMKEAVDHAKNLWMRINITFNLLPFVSDNQKMSDIIRKLLSLEANNIIIADVNVMKYFSQQKIIVSTLSSLYNSQAVKFYTSKYPNISRVVLPRELSVREKRSLIRQCDTNFEVLILNDWCYNSNAMCSSLHYGDVIKEVNYTCRRDDTYYSNDPIQTSKIKEITTNRSDCKVCSTYHYKDIDNIYFKIAGRVKNTVALRKDMLFASQITKNTEKNLSYKEFVGLWIKVHEKIFWKKCNFKQCEFYRESR